MSSLEINHWYAYVHYRITSMSNMRSSSTILFDMSR